METSKGGWLVVASMVMLLLNCPAHGASDGRIGLSSRGEIIIRLRIQPGIKISNLRDVQLLVNMVSSDSDAEYSQRFCVRSNLEAIYRLTAFSDQGGSAPFTLISPQGHRLRYELAFTGDLSSGVLGQLQPAVPSQTYTVRNTGVNCNGQDNAELKLTIPAGELQAARDSEYAGFLNLSVAIE